MNQNDIKSDISLIFDQALNSLLVGRIPDPVKVETADTSVLALIEKFNSLLVYLKELRSFAIALADGNLESETPSRKNFLASPLKDLQSKMRHISWQASQVAKGDFTQTLDFMGEYTNSFNEMISKVSERESTLKSELMRIDTERDALSQSQHILSIMLENIPDIVLVIKDGDIIFENARARSIMLQLEKKNSTDNIITFITSYNKKNLNTNVGFDYYDKSQKRWFHIAHSNFMWNDDQYADMFVIGDITESKKIEKRLKKDSEYDMLTGLGNRKHGLRILKEALSQHGSYPISLCFIDLDKLKKVNDLHGHAAGDEYIKEFTNRFVKFLDRGKLMTRFGGDEFLVMMRRTSKVVAKRLLDTIENDLLANPSIGIPFTPQFSYGLLPIEKDNTLDSEALIEKADSLMYSHKKRKKSSAESNIDPDGYEDDRLT
ncbi:MAG: diguanylate cyclase [Christensenellaceae bacterium]|jgi:diguanylate cyclase (GGDEF)-like protein|nr:diguanylate cyclase [Christensenellaceae bacterium]